MVEPSAADELALIAAAAAEAGRIALGFFRADPQVWWKEGNSPVSEADFAVDRYLKATLLAARPGYGWLSEETEGTATAPGTQRFFVVDPIDGTRAFLRGETNWCVSIALVEHGRPIAGVVDAAARAEVFTATADGPASLNGAGITVRPASEDRTLTVAVPDGLRRRATSDGDAGLVYAKSAPSLAYRLAEIACGRVDGTLIRPNSNDWDIAAADLILERAGGVLVTQAGERCLYRLEGRRHDLLVAAAEHALPALRALAGPTVPA